MPDTLPEFLTRWQPAGGAERSNYALFLTELCDLLHVPRPDPAQPDESKNNYVIDRRITVTHPDGSTSPNYIDLCKRAQFVLENQTRHPKKKWHRRPADVRNAGILPASPRSRPPKLKHGHGTRGTKLWDDALLRAKSQAENYVRSIPDDNPPFLLIVDVGYQIETYADFSGLGKTYTPFPNNLSHRFKLTDLADPTRGPELRARLQKIWTDPQSLNPAKHAAKVTREIAASLPELSKSLEAAKHDPEDVAHFLMRILFTLFAEDVKLIKDDAFTKMLESIKDKPEMFAISAEHVWRDMDKGAPSPHLRQKLLHFNGGLFAETKALPLTGNQLELLINAATQDWSDVEPAIFGTLLERALNPTERHKLGAHYTPPAYVERLVLPTVIEPLREEWSAAKNTAIQQANDGELKKAIKTVGEFLRHLCSVTILDPACGSGNFLYVTLEHLKRLEGEVNDFLHQFPNAQFPIEYTGLTVDPHQLRGIEINPRAAAITDLVLWIGYLQWHFRTHGNTMPQEPVLKKFENIMCRDAVLAYDRKELARDKAGKPLSRWDGKTHKKHPATGEDIPDELARVPIYLYINPYKATWPPADFVIGNPPFIGNSRMRAFLGDGYADAIRQANPEVPDSCDFVMYWWDQAADLVRGGALRQFGFITTNSIRQTFARRVIQHHFEAKPPLSLAFAIPDHPWVNSEDGAAVRISMTVGREGKLHGNLSTATKEFPSQDDGYEIEFTSVTGEINSDLTIGAKTSGLSELKANGRIGNRGVQLIGEGFALNQDQARRLGHGAPSNTTKVIRPYVNGRDLTGVPRNYMVIDLFGLEHDEVRKIYPEIYQWVLERVKPERDQNNRKSYRDKWWIFGEPVKTTRDAIYGLPRYIVTCRTAKHRVFLFLNAGVIPDAKLITIALDDAYHLGILSSRIHVSWALKTGAFLEDRPNYNHSDCFNKFPFPDATEKQKSRIRKIAEELDAHRKRQQAKFPDLTLTDMYNILEKLRAADSPNPTLPVVDSVPSVSSVVNKSIHAAAFSPKDKLIHDHGLISILKQLHDELDAAVFDAYGWPQTLTDDQLLEKLVALNHQRAAEEQRGTIKYLRPDFQNPTPVSPAPTK